MMSAKKLFKFLSKAFYFSLISLFVSSAYAISDVGYVGEDETEITVERSYAKLPSFPRKALRLGREGYVVVEFDIDTDGEVLDPYVVEATPQGVFERSAIKAVRKWVYEPPTYEGQSVKANNVQVRLNFNLQ
tara:strand:- start:113 stop:508 length:396 start_codon:yes stop_codon:yes gene_type:complete